MREGVPELELLREVAALEPLSDARAYSAFQQSGYIFELRHEVLGCWLYYATLWVTCRTLGNERRVFVDVVWERKPRRSSRMIYLEKMYRAIRRAMETFGSARHRDQTTRG